MRYQYTFHKKLQKVVDKRILLCYYMHVTNEAGQILVAGLFSSLILLLNVPPAVTLKIISRNYENVVDRIKKI